MDRAVVLPLRGIDLATEPPFRIGAASVEPSSREARFGTSCERIQPQHLKVLIALAGRKGQVVTRDELIAFCWEGRFIGEDVINRSISVLRRFARRAGGFEIETVPRAGYRLVETDTAAIRRPLRWIVIAAVGVAIPVAVLLLRPADQAAPPTPTIALLPFAQGTHDNATREFAAATRNSLAHTLADSGLPVKLAGSAAASRDANADFVVSGDVRSMSGLAEAFVRVEDTDRGIVVYSRRFEAVGEEAALLPERIGAQVAAALSWTGALMALDRRDPSDPAVTTELLSQLTMIVEGGDPLRAYEIARRVAPKAPDSAIAQLSIAFNTGFVLGALPRDQRADAVAVARRASDRARLLAPEFGDVHIPWCLLHTPVRLRECEDRLRSGLRVDADAPFVQSFLGQALLSVGRLNEALDLARLSHARDPYMPAKISLLIRTLEAAGFGTEAEQLYRRGTRWWPHYEDMFWSRVQGMTSRGDFGALQRFTDEIGPADLPVWYRPAASLLPALSDGDFAAIRRACTGAEQPYEKSQLCMIGLARLGDADRAFEIAATLYPRLLGRTPAEEERLWLDRPFGRELSFLSAPATAPLRRDPRFIELAGGVGLLDYWRSGRLPDFCMGSPEPVCRELRAAGS